MYFFSRFRFVSMNRKYFIILFLLHFCCHSFGQVKIGKNSSVINKSSILELESNNQGLLLPRISDTLLINNLNPPDGMLIFFTDSSNNQYLLIKKKGKWDFVHSNSNDSLYNSFVLPNNFGILKSVGSNIIANAIPGVDYQIPISLTTSGNVGSSSYSPTTGVLNIPNYTLSGLGGEPIISTGTNLQYWRGDKTWQTLNTSVVPELTNLYYTDSRSRNALSFASGSGSYSSTTGVITIPTSTSHLTNGANYITLGSLSGGGGISYNSNTGEISSTISQYTDANARSSISLTTSGNVGSSSYSPTTGVLNIPNYTLSGLGGEPIISTGTNLQYWRGDKTWQTLNTSVVPELTNLYYTDSRSRNALSFASGSGSYSSTTGVITIPTSTSHLTNGANYITLGSLSGTAPLSYNNGTGAFSISQANTNTNGYLSSTDWNTFNGKQNALTNPITGTGTTNYLSKFTASSTTGNSIVYDNGSNIGIGKSSPTANLDILQTSTNKNGIRITGAEYYQSSNNDPNNGIAIVLGVNRSQNRQVWIGSSEVMGSSSLGLLRFQTGTTIPNIDATTGDGASRLNMGLGTATTNVLIGTPDGNSTLPGSSLSVARNLSVGSSYWSTSAPTNGAIIQGNVGIGNNSPVALLALGTSGSISGSLSFAGSSSGTIFIQPRAAAGSYTLSLPSSAGNAGQLLTTDGTGNLSWTSALSITGGTLTGNLNFWQTSDYDAVNFYTGGTQTIAGKISVSSGNSVSYNTTSDYRLKQDFRQFNALSLVDSIRVYDFQWKSDKSRSYGVKAHELKSVIPYVVQGEKDDKNEDGTIKPQSVDYSKIVPVLIKAIQELNIKVENLEKVNLELLKFKSKKKISNLE